MGAGYYFQLVVVFERFASIFNIKEKRMIKIDEESKEPIKKSYDKGESFEPMKSIENEENF